MRHLECQLEEKNQELLRVSHVADCEETYGSVGRRGNAGNTKGGGAGRWLNPWGRGFWDWV